MRVFVCLFVLHATGNPGIHVVAVTRFLATNPIHVSYFLLAL